MASPPSPHGAGGAPAGLVSTAIGTLRTKEAAGSRLMAKRTQCTRHVATAQRTVLDARPRGAFSESPLRAGSCSGWPSPALTSP